MLIAHLPSGYLAGRALTKWYPCVMVAALVGSVFPDIDMLYFHLIDGGRTHHHFYPTHWPAPYAALLLIGVAFRMPWLAAFAAAAVLHMALDSVAAPIRWLAPFSTAEVELVSVPASHPNWIVSFVTHWTFLLELSICAAAGWLSLYRERRAPV